MEHETEMVRAMTIGPGRVFYWSIPVRWIVHGRPAPTPREGPRLAPPADVMTPAQRSAARLRDAIGWQWLHSQALKAEAPASWSWRFAFWTLTVPEPLPERAVRDALVRWLNWSRHTGASSYVWVTELTKRGRVHVHLLVTGWLEVSTARACWWRALRANGCAAERPTAALVHVERVNEYKDAARYVRKYVRKGVAENRADELAHICAKALREGRPEGEAWERLREAVRDGRRNRRRWGATTDKMQQSLTLNELEHGELFETVGRSLHGAVRMGAETDHGTPAWWNLDDMRLDGPVGALLLAHARAGIAGVGRADERGARGPRGESRPRRGGGR